MTKSQYLPTLLIVINIASAVMYGMESDIKHAVYWSSAALLTWSITWL